MGAKEKPEVARALRGIQTEAVDGELRITASLPEEIFLSPRDHAEATY